MSPAQKSTFLIIGAGPAGLGAARHLLDLGESDFVILEASEGPGGLASSYRDVDGFTWDLGSHLFFSRYEKVDRCGRFAAFGVRASLAISDDTEAGEKGAGIELASAIRNGRGRVPPISLRRSIASPGRSGVSNRRLPSRRPQARFRRNW